MFEIECICPIEFTGKASFIYIESSIRWKRHNHCNRLIDRLKHRNIIAYHAKQLLGRQSFQWIVAKAKWCRCVDIQGRFFRAAPRRCASCARAKGGGCASSACLYWLWVMSSTHSLLFDLWIQWFVNGLVIWVRWIIFYCLLVNTLWSLHRCWGSCLLHQARELFPPAQRIGRAMIVRCCISPGCRCRCSEVPGAFCDPTLQRFHWEECSAERIAWLLVVVAMFSVVRWRQHRPSRRSWWEECTPISYILSTLGLLQNGPQHLCLSNYKQSYFDKHRSALDLDRCGESLVNPSEPVLIKLGASLRSTSLE